MFIYGYFTGGRKFGGLQEGNKTGGTDKRIQYKEIYKWPTGQLALDKDKECLITKNRYFENIIRNNSSLNVLNTFNFAFVLDLISAILRCINFQLKSASFYWTPTGR